MRILIQNIIEPLQSYLKRKIMLVILKEKWIPQRTKLNLKEIVSCLEKNLLLLSKTLIYPFMEQHHCLCSERDYWYRNCPSQRDYTLIIDMLQSFFDFARFRFLPLTEDQANVGSEYVYMHISYKHWLHLPRYRQLFKVSRPFPSKYIYNIRTVYIYIFDSLSLYIYISS